MPAAVLLKRKSIEVFLNSIEHWFSDVPCSIQMNAAHQIMVHTTDNAIVSPGTFQRAEENFAAHKQAIYQDTDRMFAVLMAVQWVAGIAAALWISPRTWIGATSQTHMHVWAAIFLGGAISGFPVFLALRRPGHASTRHTIAIAQMLTSALLIH